MPPGCSRVAQLPDCAPRVRPGGGCARRLQHQRGTDDALRVAHLRTAHARESPSAGGHGRRDLHARRSARRGQSCEPQRAPRAARVAMRTDHVGSRRHGSGRNCSAATRPPTIRRRGRADCLAAARRPTMRLGAISHADSRRACTRGDAARRRALCGRAAHGRRHGLAHDPNLHAGAHASAALAHSARARLLTPQVHARRKRPHERVSPPRRLRICRGSPPSRVRSCRQRCSSSTALCGRLHNTCLARQTRARRQCRGAPGRRQRKGSSLSR